MTTDGGPAYPVHGRMLTKHATEGHVLEHEHVVLSAGMSKRDSFAKAAMQAWVARSTCGILDPDYISALAYVQADSMLAEREKETKP